MNEIVGAVSSWVRFHPLVALTANGAGVVAYFLVDSVFVDRGWRAVTLLSRGPAQAGSFLSCPP